MLHESGGSIQHIPLLQGRSGGQSAEEVQLVGTSLQAPTPKVTVFGAEHAISGCAHHWFGPQSMEPLHPTMLPLDALADVIPVELAAEPEPAVPPEEDVPIPVDASPPVDALAPLPPEPLPPWPTVTFAPHPTSNARPPKNKGPFVLTAQFYSFHGSLAREVTVRRATR
jgi:hypothetical protein